MRFCLIGLLLLITALTEVIGSANPSGELMISGRIYDNETGEPLTGATVVLAGTGYYSVTGLDGSFSIKNISPGDYHMEVSFISYEGWNNNIALEENKIMNIGLNPATFNLGTVEVRSTRVMHTEAGARASERNAMNAINAISARAIELSPDLTVANVVQRVSGLTLERGSGGEAQYAIVRGMDKRYNYTLVNGIKIPSPDNENRYVPLDIFPSELLDRLIVSKSLTPSMEGDAIGGVVDMKMRSAHSRRIFSANISGGYTELFLNRDYDAFDHTAVDRTPPMQRLNSGDVVAGNIDYYSSENFNYSLVKPDPDYNATLAVGDRFFDNRLGVILAGTYQRSFRGTDRTQFRISENRGPDNLPYISAYQERRYSTAQVRTGLHNKIDFKINSDHSISLYNVWLYLQKNQTRVIWEDALRAINEPTLEYNFRSQVNIQQVINSSLQGNHRLSESLEADWSVVYSIATQDIPDNSQLITVSNYDTPGRDLRWLIHENQIRIWEDNFDRDYAAYFNLKYLPFNNNPDFKFSAGGMLRLKDRDNNFDLYTFKPQPGLQEYVPYETNYKDLNWRITGGSGTPTHALNYKSYENIIAQYIEFFFPWRRLEVLGGVRAEYTDQGFSTSNNLVDDGAQTYWSILPSLHIKLYINDSSHLRSSYFRSVSRPGFLEIIPYTRPSTEDIYVRGGNPGLKPVSAHNFDLRYELFPSSTDQFLIGAFYKSILNPIEMAVMTQTDPNYQPHFPSNTTVITPLNFDQAVNYGVEVDVIRYFNRFGIRGNYTFTSSEIESIKRTWTEITGENYHQLTSLQQQNLSVGDSTFMNVTQIRPLQGQSRHLGNLSFLYKDQLRGLDAQLSMVYTGERIAVVSTGFETDWWQKSFVQLDMSVEKRLTNRFNLFIKVNNIIDTPYRLVIQKPHYRSNRIEHMQPSGDRETLVREEYYGRTFLAGLRYTI